MKTLSKLWFSQSKTTQSKTVGGIVVLSLSVFGAMAIAFWQQPSALVQPAPTEYPDGISPGETDLNFSSRRDAWIAGLHRAAPGLDWRAMDAQARLEASAQMHTRRAASLAQGGDPYAVITAAVSGQWSERGSTNQAGRVVGAFFDAANNRLTAYAHGGQIWRADRTSLNWSTPNDSTQLRQSGSGFIERLGGSERLLVMTESPAAVRVSDNGGQSWTIAAGSNTGNSWYAMGLAVRDAAALEAYALRVHYDFAFSDWRAKLFASSDRGSTFTDRGFVGARSQVALFSPRENSSAMYLLAGTQLYTITPTTHALVSVSSVPLTTALSAGEQVLLTGGRDAASGQDYLYALYSRNDHTDVYRSSNAGVSWVERTDVPSTLFGANSAEASPQFIDRLYAGGINLYRSSDGAQSWQLVNDWGQYYSAPATKLHADISNVDIFINGASDRILVGSDGGLFESTDNLVNVNNLSLSGLNVAQYYTSYTVRTGSASGTILVGAQDQGLQKLISPSAGVQASVQTISGDYAQLSSGNNGASVWMVYPGFVMLDTLPSAANQSGLRYWNFGAQSFTGWYFLPPLAADPSNGNRALLAGGRIAGGTSHRVVELNYDGSTITGNQDLSLDFGAPVTAVAFSSNGQTRYAMTEQRNFYRKLAGGSWTLMTASGLPPQQYLYGNKILLDPSNPSRIYVAGSGYSNPGVFVSNAEGQNFTAMANGLPSTMVFDLAISSDGTQLFAATELGPYYFDRDTNTWIDISGSAAPQQTWWDVDYIDATRTARFATYGRGIWDFAITDGVFKNGFEGP